MGVVQALRQQGSDRAPLWSQRAWRWRARRSLAFLQGLGRTGLTQVEQGVPPWLVRGIEPRVGSRLRAARIEPRIQQVLREDVAHRREERSAHGRMVAFQIV